MMIKSVPEPDEKFIIRDDEHLGPRVDFRKIFGNDKPVELEIGSGKGTMLVHLAKSNPEINFVGIEWANKFYRYCADRIKRWNLVNAKMMRTDAKAFVLEGRIEPESLKTLHIYFPDPWPKKKHNRRRLVNPEFCQAAVKILIPGGHLYIATDHQDYSEQMAMSLKTVPELQPCDYDSPAGNAVLTNYEAKFVKEGRNIYRFAVKKV
jgi:tRNA (guanine-N7-)-methyltransferase